MNEPKFKAGDEVVREGEELTYTIVGIRTSHVYVLEHRDKNGVLMRSYSGTPEFMLSTPVQG